MMKLTLRELQTIEVALQSWGKEEKALLLKAELENPTIDDDNYKKSINECMHEATIEGLMALKSKIKEMQEESIFEIDVVTVND